MIDSHCHLDFQQFDKDRKQVLENARAKGIEHILIPGTQAQGWQKQFHLAAQFSELSLALGIHPYFLQNASESDLIKLSDLLAQQPDSVVAVGETGLDFAVDIDKEKQQVFFECQLDLATKYALPVILHHRRSHNAIIRTLKRKHVSRGGVIHAFSGSLQEALSYIEMGFLLGVGGTITYPRASKTRKVVSQIPLQHLVLETDAPDMPIYGHQGERNSPIYLQDVLRVLAELRNEPLKEIERQTDANFNRLFKRRSLADSAGSEIYKKPV